MKYTDKISRVFSNPESINEFSPLDWDLLVRHARQANLLARMHEYFKSLDEKKYTCHAQAAKHFASASVISEKQQASVRWEVRCICDAFKGQLPLVLLKGAAYVMADLPAAKGRVFSDIDILVPRIKLDQAESALISRGWRSGKLDSYDQLYYRKWMHELPPLTHFKRATTVDVHHNILPDTAKLSPKADKLLMNIRPVSNVENVYTLSPVDMVLHSATHLFHEGELDKGLRDLIDLDSLFRHFSETEPDFWYELVPRARDLDLLPPLYYAIRYSMKILNTPIPIGIVSEAEEGKPRFPDLMDFLFDRALMPSHPSCDDEFTGLARWALYTRSHYLRMPLYLLIPHLLRKAYKARIKEKDKNKESKV